MVIVSITVYVSYCYSILQTVVILICWLFQNVGNSQREYDKLAVAFSVKNQLRYKGNLGTSCSFF